MYVDVLGSFGELEPGSLLVGQNSEVQNIDLAKVAAVLARQKYDAVSSIAPRSLVKNWLPYLEHRIPASGFRLVHRLVGRKPR